MRNKFYSYTEEDVAEDWTKSIVLVVPYSLKGTLLVAWIGGAAVRVMESLLNAKIMMDIEVFMKQHLSKEYPNMAPPQEILVKSILSVIPPRN